MDKRKVVPIKRRTKRHKYSSITYLDQDWMKINFWSLVIRVDSINRCFGQVSLFVRYKRMHAKTNGKLLVISEMISPPGYLGDIISQTLVPMGMSVNEDFVLIMEEPVRGVGNRLSLYLNLELPSTRCLYWLTSKLENKGCFISYLKPDIKTDVNNEYWDDEESYSKEDVRNAFKKLNLPWKRGVVLAWIYGDDQKLPERIFPGWIDDLPD